MVAESSTSDSDSTSSDSSEEVEGVTASLANFNRPLVPSPPMPPEAAEIMYIHKDLAPNIDAIRVSRPSLFAVALCVRALSKSAKMMALSDLSVAVALTTKADKTNPCILKSTLAVDPVCCCFCCFSCSVHFSKEIV